MSSKLFWTMGVLALCVLCAQAMAQGPSPEQELEPTVITADKMEYDHEEQLVRFSGEVLVDRPDFKLRSDRLTVIFREGAEAADVQSAMGQSEKIEKIIAEGGVSFEHEGRTGTCLKAVYLVQEEILRMEGDPQIRDGKNMIKGELITFSLKDNRSEITGGENSRVEAVFFAPTPDEAQ